MFYRNATITREYNRHLDSVISSIGHDHYRSEVVDQITYDFLENVLIEHIVNKGYRANDKLLQSIDNMIDGVLYDMDKILRED